MGLIINLIDNLECFMFYILMLYIYIYYNATVCSLLITLSYYIMFHIVLSNIYIFNFIVSVLFRNISPNTSPHCDIDNNIYIHVSICIHRNKSLSESCKIKPNLDSNYTFLIDLAPNRVLFDVEST